MNVYEIVTEQIIKQLEAGNAPWRKPWNCAEPANLVSKKAYRGINTFLLAASGFVSPYWLTFNQASKLGGHVRKGEHGHVVVFWNIGDEKLNPKTGKLSKPFLLRYYRVFNESQCEGLPARKSAVVANPIEPIAACEAVVADMPNRPAIESSNRAWYRPSTDVVGIPDKGTFHTAEGYYATLFHELAHSTGHASRVGREGIESPSFGSVPYSKEELVAEMSSAMLCGVTGISPAIIENSAAYLRSWIHVLKGDSKLVVAAASQAQRAADYIRGCRAGESEGETAEPHVVAEPEPVAA